MKLYTSLTSPYGRKCRMTAHIVGLADRLKVTEIDYHAAAYTKVNPLSKVPALERGDGSILIDSPVICAYLASLGDEEKVMLTAGEARWQALCLEALGDGMTDAGVAIFMEKKRDAALCSSAWIDAQTAKINSALDAIEAVAAEFGDSTSIGVLAVAASLGWLEFRSVVEGIREGRPNLSRWLYEVSEREFMTITAPPADA